MSNSLLLDIVLTLALTATGGSVLVARDLFQSIVLFIVFGMLLGVAWCRLDAVDVALAEFAIGAGLTGALLINTLAATRGRMPAPPLPAEGRRLGRFCATVLLAIVPAGGLAIAVFPLTPSGAVPRIAIDESLPRSGVANPVTAVLLNFRAYDTLLEVAVLLAAGLTVLAVSPARPDTSTRPVGPVLRTFAQLLVPLVVLVAAYILWVGTKAPGGAFQAAAMLGGGGVLLIVCGARPPGGEHRRWRLGLVVGLVVFLLVALGGNLTGGHFLELSPRWANVSILLVEIALTVSITLIFVVLFSGTSPRHDAGRTAKIESESAPTNSARTWDLQEPPP